MSQNRVKITRLEQPPSDIPAEYNEYVAMGTALMRSGIVAEVTRGLRLHRRRGYQGIDVFNVLLGYFAGMRRTGIKGWLGRAERHGVELAPMMGRKSLPTQSSFSRALACVREGQVRTFTDWLLGSEMPGVAPLLNTAAAQYRDSHGAGWHVFDFDPTQQAHRQRALPTDDDLPEQTMTCPSRSGPATAWLCPGFLAVSGAPM